jgi:hypothetical protein
LARSSPADLNTDPGVLSGGDQTCDADSARTFCMLHTSNIAQQNGANKARLWISLNNFNDYSLSGSAGYY